jgi:hypothetical protein
MQIRNSSYPSLSIYHNTLFSLGLSETDTTTYPVNDFIRSANNWYRRVNSWIWQVTGEWEYDDSNYTDLPVATTTLVDGQYDYSIPSTAQKIDRAEVLDKAGDAHKLIPIDKSQVNIAMTELEQNPGLPKYYDVLGRSLLLYPTPATDSITTTAGLKLYFSRDIDEFAVSDVSGVPGFSEDFHEMISVGAAIDFAELVGDTNRATSLNNRMASLKEDLKKFYGSNEREMMPNIKPNYRKHK